MSSLLKKYHEITRSTSPSTSHRNSHRNRTFLWFGSFGLCLIYLLTVIGCFKSSQPKNESHTVPLAQTIRVHLHHEPVTLDPTLAEDGVSLLILNNLFEGLVGYDGSGKLVNRIAQSFSISSDRKRYEFILRKDAKWSDGQPVLIEHFLTAFRRALGPKTASRLAPLLFPIRGARAYHDGKISAEELGIKEDQGKLVIELEYPAPYLIQALTLPPTFPLRQDVLDANHGKWPEEGPVNGAYQIIAHSLDQKMSLRQNPYYSGHDFSGHEHAEKNGISQIDFYLVGEESAALNLFLQGRLDLLTRIPSLDIPRLKKMGVLHTDPFLATYYLSFNCRKPPFNDRTWRRAIAGSIRRDEIATLLGSGELPAWSWIPHGLEGYMPYQNPNYRNPNEYYSNSVSLLNSLLKKKGNIPTSIEAAFDSGERNSQIMEKVQQDVSQSLGLRLSLNHMDWRTYVKTVQTNPPPIYRLGWLSPFLDPIPHLRIFKTGDLNNQSGFSNAHYDALVAQVEKTEPGPAREKLIDEAQQILIDEAAVIPIYHYVQNTAVSSRVKSFRINPFGIIKFQELGLE